MVPVVATGVEVGGPSLELQVQCWGSWAAPSAHYTHVGIWAEWGGVVGSPQTLVLPQDAQVGGGGSCAHAQVFG